MNQNEQQPDRTAMHEALDAYNDLGHLIVAISLNKKVPKHIRLQLSNESNIFYLKLKELRDTVEKEQRKSDWIDGFVCSKNVHPLAKAEDVYNEKYPNHGK